MDRMISAELLIEACDVRQNVLDLLLRSNKVVASLGGVTEEVAWRELMTCNAEDIPARCDG